MSTLTTLSLYVFLQFLIVYDYVYSGTKKFNLLFFDEKKL